MERFPTRIVYLAEDPTEVLYALRQEHRIVGISQFTVRPQQARKDKPRVSAFTSARIEKIMDLELITLAGGDESSRIPDRSLIESLTSCWHRGAGRSSSPTRCPGGPAGTPFRLSPTAKFMKSTRQSSSSQDRLH